MSAIDDLAASRAQLRLALAPKPASADPPGAIDVLVASLIERVLGHKQDADQPGTFSTIVATIKEIAATLLQTKLEPIAREKPLQLVAGAAAIGALLVWSRPWLWFGRGAVARLLVPLILARLLAVKQPDQ